MVDANLLDTEDVYHCWLVWKRADDGGRPYLVAVDTTERAARRHVKMVKEEAKALRREPVFVTIEPSYLNHAYGETMGQNYDRAKAMAQEIRRATIDELEKSRSEVATLEARLAAEESHLSSELSARDLTIRDLRSELDKARAKLTALDADNGKLHIAVDELMRYDAEGLQAQAHANGRMEERCMVVKDIRKQLENKYLEPAERQLLRAVADRVEFGTLEVSVSETIRSGR